MTVKDQQIEKFLTAIDKARTIALFSHVNPDGDTCGSALALYRALKTYGKQPYVFCDGVFNDKLKYLDGLDDYNKHEFSPCDLAIAVDCADDGRLGAYDRAYYSCRYGIFVDHHISRGKRGDLNIVETDAAATAEVVFDLISAMDKRKKCMDDVIAKLLYCALVTDTGGFSFSSVTQKTLLTAASLIVYDFKANEIFNNFMKLVDYSVFNLRNRVLSATKLYDNGAIAGIFFKKEDFEATGTTEADTEGIINNILNISVVKIAFSITETKGDMQYKVSFRTVDGVDANEIAGIFGGGGHKNAAGCRVSGFFEDVKDKILKACRDCI